MFFNHATDRKTNTRSDIANYKAKNQNWKSCGVRRQCQERHVRIRAICKLEQISHIWQRPLYLVADDKKFLRSSRKVSLTSGLNLSDIIEKQLLYNISAPAVLILHLAATGDRARVVFARLALGNSAFCFFAVWPKFSAAGPAGCRFSCLISSRAHCTPAF